MKKTVYIFFAIGILVTICSVVQISASNELSTKGIELNTIQKKIDILKRENTLMKEQIYDVSSYKNIASSAATLGFEPEKSPIFVDAPLPIAIRQ